MSRHFYFYLLLFIFCSISRFGCGLHFRFFLYLNFDDGRYCNHSLGYFPKDVVVWKPGGNTSPDVFGYIEGSTDDPGCRLQSDQSVCSATNRLF